MLHQKNPRSSRANQAVGIAAYQAPLLVLEQREQLSAVNDTVTVGANERSTTVDVLANDTGSSKTLVSVSNPTGGGAVSIVNGKALYSLMAPYSSLAEYTAANNEVLNKINAWHVDEVAAIITHYQGVTNAITRFGNFLDGWSSPAGSMFGTIVTNAGGAFGPSGSIAGKALNYLGNAYASNVGASNQSLIQAAIQTAANDQSAAITGAGIAKQAFMDSYNAQLQTTPNPTVLTGGTFQYTMTEMVTIRTPSGYVTTIAQPSTATVTVSMNVTNYFAMTQSVNGWRAGNLAALNQHVWSSAPDLNKLYGQTLLGYAQSRGWTVTWWQSLGYWHAAVTDIPFVLDATDIATELNAIGYRQ
jgi:hypothetical protein